jgi:hypothetical protein
MLRSTLAAILLVVFVLTLVVANTSTWATRTMLDRAAFSATVERALEAPALEDAVAAAIAEATVVGLAQRAPQVLDGAARTLGLPSGSDDGDVEAALTARIVQELHAPRVQDVRHDLVGGLHDVILGALDEGQSGLVAIRGRDVTLDADALIDRIAAATDPGVATLLREAGLGGTRRFVIAPAAALEPVRRTVDVMEALRVIVPLLAVTVALLIVVVAHRRVRALGIVGLALAGAGIASVAAVWLGGLYVSRVPSVPIAQRVVRDVYGAFLWPLGAQAVALVVLGIAIALAAWLLGRRRHRRAVARMVGPRVRDQGTF